MSKNAGSDIALFHTADLHVGACRRIHNYIERTRKMLEAIAQVVLNHKAKHKVLVIAGDVYNGDSITEEERNLAVAFVLGLIRHGIHVVMVNGNHDFVNEDGVTMLDTYFITQSITNSLLRVVTNKPGVVEIVLGKTNISFLCVPCRQNLTTKKLRKIIGELSNQSSAAFKYAVVHEAINNSISNNHVMKTGCDIPNTSVVSGIMLGDIHQHQKVGKSAWYCGSPYQTKYNDDPCKGLLLWTPGKEDPEFIELTGLPQLIRVLDPKKLSKYENTEHSVQYIGTERVHTDAVNITVRPNLRNIEEAEATQSVVEKTKHSALVGLKQFLKSKSLSKIEIKTGIKLAEQEVLR